MPLNTFPTLDLSPYALSLYGLFLGMCAQTFASFFALTRCTKRPNRMIWMAFAIAMLFLLRQRWAALEFSLATGVYDVFSAFCDLCASLFLCIAVMGLVWGQRTDDRRQESGIRG